MKKKIKSHGIVRISSSYHFIPVTVEKVVPFSSVFTRSDAEFGNASMSVSSAVQHHPDDLLAAAQIQLHRDIRKKTRKYNEKYNKKYNEKYNDKCERRHAV